MTEEQPHQYKLIHQSNLMREVVATKSLDSALLHVYDLRKKNAKYLRYMDDWTILIKTRSQLRQVVKKTHQVMHQLKFKLALKKTFIGRIERGFDFFGYHFQRGKLSLTQKTIQKFRERLAELYEQGADLIRIQQYVRR